MAETLRRLLESYGELGQNLNEHQLVSLIDQLDAQVAEMRRRRSELTAAEVKDLHQAMVGRVIARLSRVAIALTAGLRAPDGLLDEIDQLLEENNTEMETDDD